MLLKKKVLLIQGGMLLGAATSMVQQIDNTVAEPPQELCED
jgi:hypothetical protein